jgi:ABC-type spermidine/putrescine transport system, permease component I
VRRAGSRTRLKAVYYLLPNVLALGVLFFLPIATMMRYSVLSPATDAGWVERLTLEHYGRFFTDPYYLTSLLITLATGFLVVMLSLVAAYPAAHLYWRAGRRLKSTLLVLLLAPFYVNIIVKVFGWMVLLSRSGLVNKLLVGAGVLASPYDFLDGYPAILIMLVHRALPFMVLLIASSMDGIDEAVLESARVCGSGPREVFRKIILPLSVPGILAGGVLVFSLTVAAFVVPLLVGGSAGQRFVSVLMYRNISVTQNWYFGAAIGMILLVTSVLTITVSTRVFRSMRIGRVIRESFTQ